MSKAEIEKVIAWCRKIKEERGGRIYIVERNPFQEEIPWLRSKVSIEIDKPLNAASKYSLVYDSTTNKLWEFVNGAWRMVVPDEP